MTTTSPSATGRSDDASDRTKQATLARQVGATLATVEWKGVVAGITGGALLLRGLRTVGDRPARGLLQILAGVGLVAFGVTRRGEDEPRDRGDTVSDDAHAELERPDTEADSNPRDVTDDPTAEPSTEDGGRVQFDTDQTDDLDGPEDGEVDGSGPDDAVEVDLSEAAVADEAGEAAGPTSAQAEPTTTKTDLSPPSGVEEPEVEGGIGEDADEDGETEETEVGAEIHTDTVESGTMGIDEDDVTEESGEPIDDPGVEELTDDETADYEASDGGDETVETEGGAEVHTDTMESGTMDVDEEDVEDGADDGTDGDED